PPRRGSAATCRASGRPRRSARPGRAGAGSARPAATPRPPGGGRPAAGPGGGQAPQGCHNTLPDLAVHTLTGDQLYVLVHLITAVDTLHPGIHIGTTISRQHSELQSCCSCRWHNTWVLDDDLAAPDPSNHRDIRPLTPPT